MFKTVDRKHELYRIGDCIISVNGENPSKNFGGKWELLCPGRTLVCVDTSQSEFNALKKTGGSKTHTLTTAQMPSHTHSASSSTNGLHYHSGTTSSNGNHVHGVKGYDKKAASGDTTYRPGAGGNSNGSGIITSAGAHTHSYSTSNNGDHAHTIYIGNTGGGQAHNNLQPFMAVYIWVRVA